MQPAPADTLLLCPSACLPPRPYGQQKHLPAWQRYVCPLQVRRIFVNDFGAAPEAAFASFDPVPIASASLAQVCRSHRWCRDPLQKNFWPVTNL